MNKTILFLVIIVILATVFGVIAQKRHKAPQVHEYVLSDCGITVTTKKTIVPTLSTTTEQTTLTFDDDFFANCSKASVWKEKFGLNVQQFLGINASGQAKAADKNLFSVFDAKTLASIKTLYVEFPAPSPLKPIGELVGFSNDTWFYKFYFANASKANVNRDYVISVK